MSLIFAVDGERQVVKEPDPMMTLVDYLRGNGFTAPKLGCGEGGCGACTVTIASWDAEAKKPEYRSVNSCLLALCSCDGLSVTTSYGLGNSTKGYHPIQEALAAHNGSQCGFCSPGMVMSLFGKLSSTKGTKCPDALKIESCIDGNLCRCTGYRPILAAFKTFAGVDIDSVAGEKFAPFPEFLKERSADMATKTYVVDGKTWISPGTLPELVSIVQKEISNKSKWAMVAGHTSKGIYKDEHLTDVFVNVSRVKELHAVKVEEKQVSLGASVTWGELIANLEAVVDATNPKTAGMAVLVEHAGKVAGHAVRNLGTIGGNIALTKRRGFQSDLATMLAGIGATVTLTSDKQETVALDKFFESSFIFLENAVVTSIAIPFLEDGEMFKTYRTALRPINSHAFTAAAFRVKMAAGKIASANIIYGALESHTTGAPNRALKTEAALGGKAPDEETLKAALGALTTESWYPKDEFERTLSAGYLRKMFHTLRGEKDGDLDAPVLGVSQSSERPVTEGSQNVAWFEPEKAPISVPMPKLSSKLQAAGEQQFCSDLAEPSHCLHCAYVGIPKAGATFVSADTSAAESSAGYFGLCTSEDIKGANVWELTSSHMMLVPKGKAAQYADQPCILIIADTQRHAEAAAQKVVVQIEAPKTNPCLSAAHCVEAQRKADAGEAPKPASPFVKDANKFSRGDATANMASAPRKASGKAFCDGQKAFYMEPPNAFAVPGEDGMLTVWGSFQVPSWTQGMACAATGLPKNKLMVNATHIGGGFGGKLFKANHTVVACCVAAQKFRKPVKMSINRNSDSVMCGGRLPISFDYEVGFDDAGKILALKTVDHCDAGQGDACTGFVSMVVGGNMEQIYWLPNVDVQVKHCITSKPGNTAVRGPGEPQSTYIMETVIAHVAEELGVSQMLVREANIFTDLADREKVAANPTSKDVEKYSALFAAGTSIQGKKFDDFPAVGIWMSLKKKVDFDAKEAAVAKFNEGHRWRKRGVVMTPVKYGVATRNQQVLMNLYDDGTALITMDGSEIGQGLHTKVIQHAAYYLSQVVPGSDVTVDKIRVGPIGTDKVTKGSITGGSTTSEGVGEAVRDAIEKLTANMRPVKEKMEADIKEKEAKGEAADKLTFLKLVGACGESTEMQASGMAPACINYYVYGACCSEVEVDVLTGETVINSSSILYDCGKSLNPTIDLGQCEGGFMMGVGFFLRERLINEEVTGKHITNGTWEYKIPCFQDVPLKFDVEFFPRAHDKGFHSSKASGEPPLVLASSVFFAVKEAVRAGRKEFGKGAGYFRLDAPCVPRDIALAIGASSAA